MPEPNKGESQNDFVSRCIPIVKGDHPGMENKQAVAICFSKFREHQKKNSLEEIGNLVKDIKEKIRRS